MIVGAQAFSFARFGPGSGAIVLENVACTGTESRLLDCPNNGIGIHNCVHSEDASVRCSLNCMYFDLFPVVMHMSVYSSLGE